MLEEHGVVGTTAEVSHWHITVRCRRRWAEGAGFLRPGVFGTGPARLLPCVVYGSALRRRHRLRNLADKLFQTGHPGGSELLTGYGHVHVEIGVSVPQFLRMIFAPLGGTDQSFFFRVPASEHDRPLGLPARLQKLTQSVHRFQHRRRATVWVHRSIYPGISMIACYPPLIGRRRSPNFANDIPNGAELVILLNVHLHSRRARTNMVGKRQRSLPFTRRGLAAEVLENRRGVGVRKRSHGNLRQLLGFGGRNALGIRQRRSGRHSRGGWVSGKREHESYRSPLHAARRAPRPLRISVAAIIAIVFRVGINDDCRRPA